ncbi:porin [Shewanella fidelis]|uniref:Porin n=1 Tax=Shewanella fidelis TaxID=173509 RepID=A0AAW8NTK4_9GAMM|nr:porin [Shewanella fidelis]MDR8525214.1 porin [Shewanella fidelis]MDW4811285.1 porin [Shewanella fidelis]MDW4814936.1 porin [Shewanella fidelis]MDW4819026.1 porin [Shewanella fidelis]MDW4823297.1 porin [Shewanella fidelis]
MKKTLISASVASVLTLASFGALADGPSFYGRLDLAVTNSDQSTTLQGGTNGAEVGESGTYLENNFSHVGVKGSESLTSNIDVIYQMEFQVENTSGSGDVFKARNTFLGLKSQAGTVLVGRNDTVFKQAEGGVDIFGNTNADIDRLVAGQTRASDGIWYYSPKIADLVTLNATYLMEDNQTDKAGNRIDESQYALSATIGDKKLKAQNYYVAAAYNTVGGIDAYRGVAQVKLGDFKIGGLFQNTESQTTDQEGNSYFVNVAYNLNGVNLKAEYGVDESGFGKYYQNSVPKTDAGSKIIGDDINVQQITVGADYKISKSTMVYGHYAMYSGDHKIGTAKVDLEDDNVFTIGMRYNF